ncbi:hypothetical protein EI42_00087 [Thermosporothrix hazakensis]|jgi:hypothetical protein|uniref:Universal stress protein family protein n=2 Tax=Thermosporothrix TaxID=768650 RepID=A0A326UDL2_THEHA|nr:hypothetical protein [Thermosporothrix hazakensis]PZW35921.1 hypothetical protein EI42_00087 [Thermosporothrix hazakensis]BBH88388.1 hypothetical protein KTC_31390 [Thermosporothrix sp. COM3]GCE46575.1 hypothetical protein KTH_14440 [Thermosporothrix hazakensis]
MKTLLLPFLHDIDVGAIDQGFALARHLDCRLVALSLVHRPEDGVIRLEVIQQSKDFLEFLYRRSRHFQIPLQRIELHTPSPLSSIRALASELNNASILLFMRNEKGVLLDTDTILAVLQDLRLHFYLVLLHNKHEVITMPQAVLNLLQDSRQSKVTLTIATQQPVPQPELPTTRY